jgi:transcriptional regulator with AAA-type ATPase domain
MLRLAVVIEGQKRHFGVPEGLATLGSARDNDLVVDCAGVSRRHAIVERSGKRITLRDAGSKNGLVVGGRRVPEVTLETHTDVKIGRALIRLEEIDTGDAELGLSLDGGSSSRGTPIADLTETASAAADAARKLLQWVRLAEQGSEPFAALLDGARDVLGATTLMIVQGDSVIAEISGPLPPPDALRALAAQASPHWLVVERDRDTRVCACFSEPVSSAWRRDFLEFAAGRLCGASVSTPPSEERTELAFGDAIVRGTSPAMTRVYEQVAQAVRSDLNVLLLGETGTGKEVIARLIHRSDRTRAGEFVLVNTAGVAATMLEAELFGVERGAATEVHERLGAFRSAGRGTILLDEIGDMPPSLQAKLLHAVQSHAVIPVGASLPVAVDVRVIAATHHDLQKLVGDGTFRSDLFFRLNGISISIPPLRGRLEDLPQLAKAFTQAASQRLRKHVRGITANAMQLLLDYPWPGNIRELQYVVERAVLACPPRGAIDTSHIRPSLQTGGAAAMPSASLEGQRVAAETAAIEDALRAANGNRTAAARILGISRATLHKKLKHLLKR